MSSDHLEVVAIDGSRACRICGDGPAILDSLYCSPRCRADARHVADDPSPDEIATQLAAIRAAWGPKEIARRAAGEADKPRSKAPWRPPRWTPPVIELADLEA
jgi:hypothetical protein